MLSLAPLTEEMEDHAHSRPLAYMTSATYITESLLTLTEKIKCLLMLVECSKQFCLDSCTHHVKTQTRRND